MEISVYESRHRATQWIVSLRLFGVDFAATFTQKENAMKMALKIARFMGVEVKA